MQDRSCTQKLPLKKKKGRKKKPRCKCLSLNSTLRPSYNISEMPVVKKAIKTVYLDTIPHVVKPFEFPALSSVKVSELPNNGFGNKNYYIPKTKFGHWPVYLKIQNTKITTEIKRLKGDLTQFKSDLLESVPGLNPKHVSVNEQTGNINVKGDLVEILKDVFTQKVKREN